MRALEPEKPLGRTGALELNGSLTPVGGSAPDRHLGSAGAVDRRTDPTGVEGRDRLGALDPKGAGESATPVPPAADRGPAGRPGGASAFDGQEAAGILERARVSVDPELRRAVQSLPGSMRRVARYHFGWEDAHGVPATGNAGKAIRPALVLAAVAALGGRESAAVRAAAAVELVHNFTLLHDDVMDRDATRRHRATAWTVFGVPDAILAGDAMQALAQQLLAEDPHPASAAASARLASCVVELCAGQHTDTEMEGRRPEEVTLDEVLAMAEAKTGALLGCACAMGALYAGAGEEDVEALDAFGREAGLAFQLIDDVIGIWGTPAARASRPGRISWSVRSPSRWSPRSPPAPRRPPNSPSSTDSRTRREIWNARHSWWSGRAVATGHRSRRPTVWPEPCTNCPVRSRTRSRPADFSRWPSS